MSLDGKFSVVKRTLAQDLAHIYALNFRFVWNGKKVKDNGKNLQAFVASHPFRKCGEKGRAPAFLGSTSKKVSARGRSRDYAIVVDAMQIFFRNCSRLGKAERINRAFSP